MKFSVSFLLCPLLGILIFGVIPSSSDEGDDTKLTSMLFKDGPAKKMFDEAMESMKDHAGKVSETLKDSLTAMQGTVEDNSKKSWQQMEEVVNTMKEHMESSMKEASEKFENLMESVKEDSENKKTKVSGYFEDIISKMKQGMESLQERSKKLFKGSSEAED